MYIMKETIRILNLFTIMNRGGAETMVMNYYRSIDRTRVQFDFLVHRTERGAYDDEIEQLGGKIYRMPAIRPWTARNYMKKMYVFYKDHPEYLIIHSHMSELGFYAFKAAECAGVPIRICHAHNRPYGIDMKSVVRWYYKTFMMKHITHMFVCGIEAGNWLFGIKNQTRFIQLNNAVETKEYIYNQEKRNKVRVGLGIENKVVIGHIGRFSPQKNHSFLIKVFQEIHKRKVDSVLLLIGDDSGKKGIEIHKKVKRMGLEKSVFFLGTRDDVPDLLQAMDVFLFPSKFEGLSVASIEVQAAGVPSIISDRIPIECKKTDLVHVVSLDSTKEEWAEEVLKASKIKHRDTYEDMKKAGFDIAENARWLENFYLSQIKRFEMREKE